MSPDPNDPRLLIPQCIDLQPIEQLLSNDWFTVRNRGGYYTVEPRLPQVIILPIVNRDSVILVRVKRPVLADSPFELPAGGCMDNETPSAAAARELSEETGVRIGDLNRFVPLPPLSGNPNRSPFLLHVFLVEISSKEFLDRHLHDSEIQEVLLFSLGDALQLIAAGEIYVSVPVAVISRYALSRTDILLQRIAQ